MLLKKLQYVEEEEMMKFLNLAVSIKRVIKAKA